MTKQQKWDMFLLLFTAIVSYWAGVTSVWRGDFYKSANKAIEECQKDLPRSQTCELTAKVKEGKE